MALIAFHVGYRNTTQDVQNILGALYIAMLFLGIINSRAVQNPTSYERMVRPQISFCSAPGFIGCPVAHRVAPERITTYKVESNKTALEKS